MAGARLQDRVAIVTGAGSGIGRAVAEAFVAEGAVVTVAELDEETGRATAADLGDAATFVPVDVGRRDQVEAMVAGTIERSGGLDILVNNAWGGGRLSRIEEKSPALVARAMDVGFHGPLWAMTAALPALKAGGRGRIINMGSLNGVNAHMGTAEYNSAKEALRAATRTAAREWAPWGITANVICPAAKTGAFAAVMADDPGLEAAADAANPMGRIGDPRTDIAPVAVFLAGDDSRYVTGNTLFVDGGGHINGVPWVPDLGEPATGMPSSPHGRSALDR